MREIKFRAWNKSARAMLEWGYLRVCGQHLLFVDSLTWMQFTGLIDKNGKEIYEGDMVHRTRVDRGNDKQKVVQWRIPKRGGIGFNLRHCDDCIEVIGNIYENPELVSGTQKGLDLEG